MSIEHYILIDAKTRKPVPLPYEVTARNGNPITIRNAFEPDSNSCLGELSCYNNETRRSYRQPPCVFGLLFMTEADFMAEQQPTTSEDALFPSRDHWRIGDRS